ncbi:hypothetical protein ACFS6H_12205 [Terrimonas rubra]|uniref:Carboxypeptidase regulatory-like domain-containing protein n=1 Tax=Terrimonas rubra TaxID=1035890 RepID=A0ABW6A7S9_9BACT
MKATISVCLLIVSMQAAFAQQTKIFNQNASRSNHTRLSLSAGGILSHNDLSKNGFNAQADAFVPLYRKGWDGSVKGSGFTLGANIAVNYAGVKNSAPDNKAVADKYQVYAATNTVSVSEKNNSSGSLSGLVGVQAMFRSGNFHISPVVSTGYSYFTLQGFTQTGTYSANGQSQDKDLVKREKKSSGGIVFKPQLRIGYDIAPSLSLFASSAYIMGPEIKYTTQNWLPQGGFNQQNMYEPQQMQNGSWSVVSGREKYKGLEVNLGISLAIGKSKGSGASSSSYAAGRLSMTPTTPKQSQGKNFGEKVATGMQSGSNALSQGASLLGAAVGKVADGTSGYWSSKKSYDSWQAHSEIARLINTAGSPEALQQIKIDYLTNLFVMGEKDGAATLKPELFREVKSQNDWKGKRVAVSKDGRSYSYLGDQDDLAAIISIPGATQVIVTKGIVATNGNGVGAGNPTAIVQQCADCTTSTCTSANGTTTTYDCNCVNGFCMCILCPDITTLTPLADDLKIKNGSHDTQMGAVRNIKARNVAVDPGNNGKSINEKGVKRIDAATFAHPGQPIKGVIVKGGKNPGGNFDLVTNDNGEVFFTATETGEYRLQFTAPAPGEKSISEKGVAASKPNKSKRRRVEVLKSNKTGDPNALVTGTPIGGIVVKGGKNPSPGNNWGAINVVSDDNGEVVFTIGEPGEYRLQVTAPGTPDNGHDYKR